MGYKMKQEDIEKFDYFFVGNNGYVKIIDPDIKNTEYDTGEEMNRKETRLVVVDVTTGKKLVEKWDVEIEESVQDDGKTLKIFLRKKQ